jgi:ABC-type sugar transport system ATPase subunit
MQEILKVDNILKSFPGVLAVDYVSFSLQKGEILALVGENGAGKSTLTNMLSGVISPDKGHIIIENKPVSFQSSHDAILKGISMVFQELSLVGNLSVAENIFSNRHPLGPINNIRWRQLYRETRDLLSRFNLDLDPMMPVKRLSMGQRQILEILKAISTSPIVLILDEPTSSLAEGEIDYLFRNIRKLQSQGMSFIYITHKLSEVFKIADRVMVMRDGKNVGIEKVSEVTEADLVAMMVGRQIGNIYGAGSGKIASSEYFRVVNFCREGIFQNITFGLRRGEILGLAGLVGAGRTELARAIFGLEPEDSGQIYLDGQPVKIAGPRDAIKYRIAYLTEDRKAWGLFLDMQIRDNLIAPFLKQLSSSIGFMKKKLINRHALEKIDEFAIATPSIYQKVLNLSGGNQQKCLIAMWMGIRPEVIIFDEPTRGVDVGARVEIYQKLRRLASAGAGIIMISSDLPELIGMCDRILVMHQGKIKGEVLPADYSEELILSFAAGINSRPLTCTIARGAKEKI